MKKDMTLKQMMEQYYDTSPKANNIETPLLHIFKNALLSINGITKVKTSNGSSHLIGYFGINNNNAQCIDLISRIIDRRYSKLGCCLKLQTSSMDSIKDNESLASYNLMLDSPINFRLYMELVYTFINDLVYTESVITEHYGYTDLVNKQQLQKAYDDIVKLYLEYHELSDKSEIETTNPNVDNLYIAVDSTIHYMPIKGLQYKCINRNKKDDLKSNWDVIWYPFQIFDADGVVSITSDEGDECDVFQLVFSTLKERYICVPV